MANYIHINQVKESRLFYMFPKWLLGPGYKKLSDRSKLFYMYFWDRVSLSEDNKWYDNKGRVYIYSTIDELENIFGCSKPTVINAKKELTSFGLIKEVRQGVNKPNRIYVIGSKKPLPQEAKNLDLGSKKPLPQEAKNLDPINTEYIKTNISRLSEPEGVGETSYLDIEQTPPPPPKKSMSFGQFVKTSGLKVRDHHVHRLIEYIGIDNMDLDLVKLAITKTVDQGIEAPKYTFSILDNWKAKGITTLEQGLKEQEEFEARKASNKKSSQIDEDEAKRMQEKYGF